MSVSGTLVSLMGLVGCVRMYGFKLGGGGERFKEGFRKLFSLE